MYKSKPADHKERVHKRPHKTTKCGKEFNSDVSKAAKDIN